MDQHSSLHVLVEIGLRNGHCRKRKAQTQFQLVSVRGIDKSHGCSLQRWQGNLHPIAYCDVCPRLPFSDCKRNLWPLDKTSNCKKSGYASDACCFRSVSGCEIVAFGVLGFKYRMLCHIASKSCGKWSSPWFLRRPHFSTSLWSFALI